MKIENFREFLSEIKGRIGLRWTCRLEHLCWMLSEWCGRQVDSVFIRAGDLQSETSDELKSFLSEFDRFIGVELRSDGIRILYELDDEVLSENVEIFDLSDDSFSDIWNLVSELSSTLYKWCRLRD